jgi:2-oxoglutarate ferredoxin oxidoreductase subunit beta
LVTFRKPDSLLDVPFHYCAGCGHGIVHRLIAEGIDELGIREKTIGAAPVGCAVFAYNYFNFDMVECAHGRAPAVATGIKRVNPESIVFTYQGDGDLMAIGVGELIHAAARGEEITIIFVNNAIYGMTGGQMAPTTLITQRTQTTPRGRSHEEEGYPIKACELLQTLDGVAYLARVAVNSPQNILKAKKAIERAFRVQMDRAGFSLVEILSPCPVAWGLSPREAIKWLGEQMIPFFPIQEFKIPEVRNS